MALIQAAEELGVRYHVGITASTDTFYTGQGRPGFRDYFPSHKDHLFRDMQQAGVQNFEMEASCLFTLAGLFGKRAGAVCVIVANRVTDEFLNTDEMQVNAGRVASHAVSLLAAWDEKKKAAGKSLFYPSLME
jgi:uridine phosphorylase